MFSVIDDKVFLDGEQVAELLPGLRASLRETAVERLSSRGPGTPDFEAGRAAGYDGGYARGYDDGRADGLAARIETSSSEPVRDDFE